MSSQPLYIKKNKMNRIKYVSIAFLIREIRKSSLNFSDSYSISNVQ